MRAEAGVVGPDGRPEPPKPPEPSEPQRWLRIAAEDDLLADALTYFARGDDWFDVYKALECLEMRGSGARRVSQPRLARATRARSSCSSGPQTQDDMQDWEEFSLTRRLNPWNGQKLATCWRR